MSGLELVFWALSLPERQDWFDELQWELILESAAMLGSAPTMRICPIKLYRNASHGSGGYGRGRGKRVRSRKVLLTMEKMP